MKKRRLIPLLLLRNGWLVQSKNFEHYKNLGNPITAVERLSTWASDELIYLDISKDDHYDMRRDDIAYPNRHNFLDIIEDVSKVAFMPITVGGRIRTLQDIESRLKRGADKITINTKPLEDTRFIAKAAKEFGSQCIVISIDVRKINDTYCVYSNGGQIKTKYDVSTWAKTVENLGAGEILINSIERDGMRTGYDLDLLDLVSNLVKIPVIGCGGVGGWQDFADGLTRTKVDAVAAANIFHFTDQSVFLAKRYLYENGCNTRPADLLML